MLKVWAYKCEYCGKVYEYEKACKMHEDSCKKNPYGFNCRDCRWSEGIANRRFTCSKGHKVGARQFWECKDREIREKVWLSQDL